MKHHAGFMLIELIVATLIASLLSAVLLTALSQSTRVQTSVDSSIYVSERIAIAVSQLEKDLAGAFVPVQSEKKKEQAATKSQEKIDDNQKKGPKKDSSSTQVQDQKTDQKKEPKIIEKIFYGTNKNGMLDTLTLITNNPLVVFVGKDVGTVKPKVVRVQYTLKPDPEHKDSFTLFRQESNELDLAEYKNVRPYEVIGGIKKLSVSYTARILRQDQNDQGEKASSAKVSSEASAKEKSKKSYEYKTQPDWTSEKKDENKKIDVQADKKEPEFPRIPYSVEFKMTLWDAQHKKEKDFMFICAIPVDSIEAQLKDKKPQREPTKKEEAKPAPAEKQPGQSGEKVAMGQQVRSEEVVVYNGIEVVATALDSLKKLLGHV